MQKALANARIVSEGRDPRDRASRAPNFEQAVEKVIGIQAENWKDGGKSAAQWRASLRDYAVPKMGAKRVDRISTADIMEVLLPIWSTKRETARRVRLRIGAVLKWAAAQGYREDNPAGDAISAALPKNSVRRRHQRALPHSQVAEALVRVRTSKAHRATALAFEFLVLTACRSGEVRGGAVGRGGRRLPMTGKGHHTGRVLLSRDGTVPPLRLASFVTTVCTRTQLATRRRKIECPGPFKPDTRTRLPLLSKENSAMFWCEMKAPSTSEPGSCAAPERKRAIRCARLWRSPVPSPPTSRSWTRGCSGCSRAKQIAIW